MTDVLEKWSEYVTTLFGYNHVLAMNSGAEAVETAIKMARKYGSEILHIDEPIVVSLTGNFHGRTMGSLSLSDYSPYRDGFGPLLNNLACVVANDVYSLKNIFKLYGNSISAVIYEPIQGEGGINILTHDFLHEMLVTIKRQYPQVLFIADEIQCGLGRSGDWTASRVLFPEVKPDALILGKALSGGMMPMSCVLANSAPMGVFTPGTHGSTFGGNPLACATSMTALQVLQNECLQHVEEKEQTLKSGLHEMANRNQQFISKIRGKGLFYGIQFHNNYNLESLRKRLMYSGYITSSSRHNTLRITPPLTISHEELQKAVDVIEKCIK
jgi:ornithine--oxo-acid transaminase